jgi:hypothetical protein
MTSTLAPVRITRSAPAITRTGIAKRPQAWAARAADGAWGFDRTEEPGTPWEVFHLTSVADGSLTLPLISTTTLRSCRLYVGSGQAVRDLAVMKCGHPESARGHKVERGSWDYHYQTCSACQGIRPVHDDDDRYPTCWAAEDGTGPAHEWSADLSAPAREPEGASR